eukprot:13357630-Alexandrium_andersonii.AAC.1
MDSEAFEHAELQAQIAQIETFPAPGYKDIDVDMESTHTSPETAFIFANRPDVFNTADKSKKRPHSNAELSGIRYFG